MNIPDITENSISEGVKALEGKFGRYGIKVSGNGSTRYMSVMFFVLFISHTTPVVRGWVHVAYEVPENRNTVQIRHALVVHSSLNEE